jgi:hypothetical protein
MLRVMPQTLWPDLIEEMEKIQTAEDRDKIYLKFKEIETRERSWFTCKRMPGPQALPVTLRL